MEQANNSNGLTEMEINARIDFTLQTIAKLIEQHRQKFGDAPTMTPFGREREALLDGISKLFPEGNEILQWRLKSGMEKCENEYFESIRAKAERADYIQNQFNRIMESHPYKAPEDAMAEELSDPYFGKLPVTKGMDNDIKEILCRSRNTFRELLPYAKRFLDASDVTLRKLKQRYIDKTGDKREETRTEEEKQILDAVRAGDTDFKTEQQLVDAIGKPWTEIKALIEKMAEKNMLEYRDGLIIR